VSRAHETAEDLLVLVDEDDRPVGEVSKRKGHRHPVPLHRAFSVFLFDAQGRCLVTRRSAQKHTWPDHWSNACCSHPRPGEPTADAAARRVREELGVATPLRFLFAFRYEARYDERWGENEWDHVFVGRLERPDDLEPDEDEVAEWRLVGEDELRASLAETPERYTPWFLLSVERVLAAARGLGEAGAD